MPFPFPPYAFGNPAAMGAAGFDSDAAAFFTAASITDATQKGAVNALVLALKAASLWSKMVALYPYVGGAATPHSFNLKNPAQYQMTWGGVVTHDANGVTGDGSGYGDTGLLGSVLGNHCALSFYQRTTNGAGAVWRFMGETDAFATTMFLDRFDGGGSNRWLNSAGTIAVSEVQRLGLVTASCIADNDRKIYGAATQIASDTGNNGDVPAAVSHFVLACNTGSGAVDIPTNANFALHAFSAGLTAAEVTAWSNAVTAYQTALGRNV